MRIGGSRPRPEGAQQVRPEHLQGVCGRRAAPRRSGTAASSRSPEGCDDTAKGDIALTPATFPLKGSPDAYDEVEGSLRGFASSVGHG